MSRNGKDNRCDLCLKGRKETIKIEMTLSSENCLCISDETIRKECCQDGSKFILSFSVN